MNKFLICLDYYQYINQSQLGAEAAFYRGQPSAMRDLIVFRMSPLFMLIIMGNIWSGTSTFLNRSLSLSLSSVSEWANVWSGCLNLQQTLKFSLKQPTLSPSPQARN